MGEKTFQIFTLTFRQHSVYSALYSEQIDSKRIRACVRKKAKEIVVFFHLFMFFFKGFRYCRGGQ